MFYNAITVYTVLNFKLTSTELLLIVKLNLSYLCSVMFVRFICVHSYVIVSFAAVNSYVIIGSFVVPIESFFDSEQRGVLGPCIVGELEFGTRLFD